MTSWIFLKNVRIYACHGVMPQERAVGAGFEVSLRAGYDISRAMESDDVADTVSYADLLDIIREEMAVPSALLEHVAGRIASAVAARFDGLESLDLTITKINPPFGADCDGAGVELHLDRGDLLNKR